MAFILNTKIDVAEEWVTCEKTGIEQLVSTEGANKYDVALDRARNKNMMAAAGDVTNVSESDLTTSDTVALLIGAFIVKDWKGVNDENGEPVLLTKENYLSLARQTDAPANVALEKLHELRNKTKKEVKKTKGK